MPAGARSTTNPTTPYSDTVSHSRSTPPATGRASKDLKRAGPGQAALYVKRGDLHRVDENWSAAEADFKRAANLAPDLTIVDYHLGRTWFESGRADLAVGAFSRFLKARPDHARAHAARGRSLARLGDFAAAADDMGAAVQRSGDPSPDLFIDRARYLIALAPPKTTAALRTLDDGIVRLGPIVTLVGLAVEIESGRGRHQAALDRIDSLAQELRDSPAWLERRGGLLLAGGKGEDARDAYRAALKALSLLPARRRSAPAMAAMANRLRDELGESAVQSAVQ